MPKEVIKEWRGGKPHIEVRWGPEHFSAIQVGIDRFSPFTFKDDPLSEEYTSLFVVLESREDVDALIKALHKAKRKTFPK